MSVNGSVFFVDWDAVQEQWRDEPAAFWRDDWLYGDDGEQCGWSLPQFRREDYHPRNWIGSWKYAAQVDKYYRLFRRDLRKPIRAKWDRLFTVFLAIDGDPGPFDLPGFRPSEGVANILSPATIRHFAAMIQELDVELLRSRFDAWCRPKTFAQLKDFDDFASYLQQWFAAVEAAQQSGKAMVLWVA